MSPQEPKWKEFEQAVAAFVAALDPAATVCHDVRLADRHTRRPRQRDVWIEAKVCQHFPITILVSCKRWERKVHQGSIDAFNGELASSHARLGVIYSYIGFTGPAIEKAEQLGISCCRLYRNQPPEIPEILAFPAYCCSPQISLSLSPHPASAWHLQTWQELFDLTLSGKGKPRTVLHELVERYHEAERAAVQAAPRAGSIPQPFRAELSLPSPEDSDVALRLVANGRWEFYRARLEAYLVNGSYEFTTGDFRGQISTPWIDRFGVDPGPGWERLQMPPEREANLVMLVLYQGGAKEALLKNMGPKRLTDGV